MMGLNRFTNPPLAIFFGLLLPALDNEIATACFCGKPSPRNLRTLLLIVFELEPRIIGMIYP
jgi:hypothetical protein|tara:strand:- start:368 stop:553 length:186 start_codon:yes stop_codon:yes gene_type:complete